jgi:amino acid permease
MRDTTPATDPDRVPEVAGRVPDDGLGFLTRAELLGGLPARRASTLLFAIESRTAHLVKRSRIAFGTYRSEAGEEERERAFLEALAQGRDLPVRPTIQDIERHAPRWASLVPADDGVRAALGKMIGDKYPLPATGIPGITAALALATPGVTARFQSLYGQPLTSVFTEPLRLRERWRWVRASAAARLESLPPFWTAFAVTLTETVGAGILALPIAFASVGPIAGIIVLIVLGLVNVMTIAAMAEAVARNGNVRYGRGYFRRMIGDYLGPVGASVLTPVLLCSTVLGLLVYFIGFSSTLADATGISPEVWAAALFVVLVVFLRRERLDATVASALAIGATTITLIVLLCLLALPHLSGANLRHAEIPFWHGRPFDRSLLALIFGVVLCAYFGHTTTANCATVVLDRDPSGRALIRGASCGLLAAIGLYVLWVFAVNGAVAPSVLVGQDGVTIGPLADVVGTRVTVIGVIFVTLAMGMASIHYALGLSYQLRDLLPRGDTGRSGLRRALASARGRRLAGFAPVVVLFALVEWLFVSGHESFAGPLGFVGVVATPIVAGIFPMVMLASARRKGDCLVAPGRRLIGHPVVVGVTVALFMAGIAVHGLVIWEDPLRRVVALLTTLVLVAVLIAIRRVAFTPRTAVEIRLDDRPRIKPAVNVLARGEPVAADVEWSDDDVAAARGAGDGRRIRVRLPAAPVRELKIWAHRLSADGRSTGVTAIGALQTGRERRSIALDEISGQVLVPTNGDPVEITLALSAENWPGH